MDQDKVNPFVGNTETSAGGSPVSAPSNPAANQAPVKPATPSVPVNPYAPAGAPYAPGSNTPAPDFATPSDGPAVPNTGSSAYTNFSPAPSQNYASPEKPKLFTKKFIIFAVIGIVLIIAAIVAGVVIQNTRKSKTTSSGVVVTNSYQKPLNTYTNYIVSGSDSSEHKDFTYNENTNYFLTSKLHNYVTDTSAREDARAAITNAKKYFEIYYSQVPDNEKENSSESGISIDLYRDIVNLMDYIINNQPSSAETLPAQFVQELKNLDLGPATVYASLYEKYIESEESNESTKDLDNFINSYAAYLLYNSSELDIQARGRVANE